MFLSLSLLASVNHCYSSPMSLLLFSALLFRLGEGREKGCELELLLQMQGHDRPLALTTSYHAIWLALSLILCLYRRTEKCEALLNTYRAIGSVRTTLLF